MQRIASFAPSSALGVVVRGDYVRSSAVALCSDRKAMRAVHPDSEIYKLG